MNRKILTTLLAALLGGCSSAYIVPDGASTTQVFQEACGGCHKAKESPESYFKIKMARRNSATISEKIQGGGVLMPAFPNITGSQLQKLSQFVLEHSIAKRP